jgi:hypothetical protein
MTRRGFGKWDAMVQAHEMPQERFAPPVFRDRRRISGDGRGARGALLLLDPGASFGQTAAIGTSGAMDPPAVLWKDPAPIASNSGAIRGWTGRVRTCSSSS